MFTLLAFVRGMYNLMKDGNNIESEPKRKQGQRLRNNLSVKKRVNKAKRAETVMRGALYKMNND